MIINNETNMELMDILQESVNIGLGKAASVIGQLVDSYVGLSAVKIYTSEPENEVPLFSQSVVVMEIKGDIMNGKTVFSMNDDQLIKLIKYLEGFQELDMEDEEILEIIADTYQEIGNIILGNVISSMVDFFGIRADINVPYLSTSDENMYFANKKLLVIDVMFNIEKLDAAGKLYLINDYESYMKLAKWVEETKM